MFSYSKDVRVKGTAFLNGDENTAKVEVAFFNEEDSLYYSTTTDISGYYEIFVEPGHYNVYCFYEIEEHSWTGVLTNQNLYYRPNFHSLDTIILDTLIRGSISGIFKKSSYYFGGEITVEYNDTLVVESGTRFYFNPESSLKIYGELIVDGNNGDEVIFAPSSKKWHGVNIINSNHSELRYLKIEDAVFNGMNIIKSFVNISNSMFVANKSSEGNGGALYLSNARVNVSNSVFESNDYNSVYAVDSKNKYGKLCC